MSVMSKKDFLLIQDAINEGIAAYFSLPTTQDPNTRIISIGNERNMRLCIAQGLAHRLKYASDNFDADIFKSAITSAAGFSCTSEMLAKDRAFVAEGKK
jgi:hypothetical protein